MNQVFISYKSEQIELAQDFAEKIKAAGFTVWMDSDIRVGTEWREEIDVAISNSIALVVIMTPEANESKYVAYEWAFAYGTGVRVIPILYIEPKDLHPRLRTLQYVIHDDPEIQDKLINSLRDTLSSYLSIQYALWGSREKIHDVTSIIRQAISDGRIDLTAHTDVLGEPARGERKKLVVFYACGGKVDIDEVEENRRLILPE